MFGEIVFFKEFASFASKLCKLLSNLVVLNDAQRPRIYAGMELEFPSAGTVAKFIIKSSLLFLSFIRVFSAETTDEIYSNAHC